MASGLHWSPETIFKLTDTQLVLWNHAAYVNYERGEEQRRREKTCDVCYEEAVFDGVCGKCKSKKFVKGKPTTRGGDILNWVSPSTGKVYKFVGDEFESAATKFKKACRKNRDMSPYKEYASGMDLSAPKF